MQRTQAPTTYHIISTAAIIHIFFKDNIDSESMLKSVEKQSAKLYKFMKTCYMNFYHAQKLE